MKRKTKRIISRTVTHAILILGAVAMLLPFFWMLTTSFKSLNEVFVSPPRFFGNALYGKTICEYPPVLITSATL